MNGKNDFGYIFTVSDLTRRIKTLLEETYPFLWVTGEISNLAAVAASGHVYFSLRDDNALINCVIFRNQKKRLAFNPENGMKITGMCRVSLYEPRGSYQLIFEHIEPEGAGALQIRFEQLKNKLAQEGLFDETLKKKIPFLPSKISVITSATGAAVKDIISIAKRRFPNVHMNIFPVRVQGMESEREISEALEIINERADSDVIILARGGGSMEDLAAFNSETVARAVFQSCIPVISAVGHETDFTIADFVADLRAPTPSAAAELALPEKNVLSKRLTVLEFSLAKALEKQLLGLKENVFDLKNRLKNPLSIVHDMRFKLEDLESRLVTQLRLKRSISEEKLIWLKRSLHANTPHKRISGYRQELKGLTNRLKNTVTADLAHAEIRLEDAMKTLHALSPMAVLERGYSITRKYPEKEIIRDSGILKKDDTVEILLARGKLVCQVKKKE